MTRPLCIYHANCQDGFTAAWVVNKALDGDVDFHPGVYGETPPDVTGRAVFIVDFSYKATVIAEMAKAASIVYILDHHKSAIADLEANGTEGSKLLNPDKVCWTLDVLRSGAGITWDHFFDHATRPRLIDHVEDRDLWRFKIPRTRDYSARLFAEDYYFATWDAVVGMNSADYNHFCDAGAAINKKHMKDVRELVKVTRREMQIGGVTVPVANLPYTYTSEAGNLMAYGVPFAACYWDTATHREFSLRSDPYGEDVSIIAQRYGGGGHAHAAGFRVLHNKVEEEGLI